MGLDMRLYGERFIRFDEETLSGEILKSFPELSDGVEIKQVDVEVGYWRKANQIHNWFVNNLQGGEDDCRKSHMPREKIRELRDICQKVIDNPDQAEKLLPTRSGFFFGGTEYDSWYFEDLKKTIKICDRALTLTDNWDLYYQSSW